MPVSDADMIAAWTQVLALSRLEAGNIVTVVTSSNTHSQTLLTAIIAAAGLGAVVNRLDLQPMNGDRSLSRDPFSHVGTTPLSGNAAAVAALKESHLVLDLMTLPFSPEHQGILNAGTRILLAVEPPEVLVRLLPTVQDRFRVREAGALLDAAKEIEIISEAGTDLRCRLGEHQAVREYGFVDEPGRWDHWPSGLVLTWPNEASATGTVVVDRGDILLPMKSYVTGPITLTVEGGFVSTIDGGVDAELMRDYMTSFDDPNAYAVSHVGWGLQKRARWSTLGLFGREATVGMDARGFEGNFLFSIGPHVDVAGSRSTAGHIDIPMRNCTVSLDGTEIVREGKIVVNPRSV